MLRCRLISLSYCLIKQTSLVPVLVSCHRLYKKMDNMPATQKRGHCISAPPKMLITKMLDLVMLCVANFCYIDVAVSRKRSDQAMQKVEGGLVLSGLTVCVDSLLVYRAEIPLRWLDLNLSPCHLCYKEPHPSERWEWLPAKSASSLTSTVCHCKSSGQTFNCHTKLHGSLLIQSLM